MHFRHSMIIVGLGLLMAACAPLEDHRAALEPQFETITFANSGWKLHGDWTYHCAPESGSAVLLLHRAAGTRAEFPALAKELCDRGIASMALDLRGHGESTNLGRFEAPFSENLYINEGAHEDIAAALSWLKDQEHIDGNRLGVLGASYSGEAAAQAHRNGHMAQAYVMMSPGSFSSESIRMIDSSNAKWLFIRTSEEGPVALQYIDEIHRELESEVPTAERHVYEGAGHATRILETHPESIMDIAVWFEGALAPD